MNESCIAINGNVKKCVLDECQCNFSVCADEDHQSMWSCLSAGWDTSLKVIEFRSAF